MKKQITALLCSAIVCGTACAAVMPRANATEVEYADEITIAAYEPIGDLDIFSAKEVSSTDEWIFNTAYDRLLEVDDDGFLRPSLLEKWYFDGEDILCGMSSVKRKSLPDASVLPKEYEGEYYNELPDDPFEAEGFGSDLPINGPSSYLGGDGPLVITMQLRDDLYFYDGCPITSEKIEEMINTAKSAEYEGSMANRQWSPVYYFEYLSDFTFNLYLSFSGLNYGFMDFMYGLASPYGSIVHKEGDEIIGSGAYNIVSNTAEGVRLERNEDWWSGSVPTQYITFKTSENNTDRYSMLHSGEADIGFLDGEGSVNQYDEGMFDYEYVATNLVMAFYDPSSEVLQNAEMRRAVDYSINNLEIIRTQNLLNESNDYWAFVHSNHYPLEHTLLSDNGYADVVKGYADFVKLNLLTTKSIENSLKTTIYGMKNFAINGYLDISVTSVEDDLLESEALQGNYDIVLAELDPYNIDSIYNAFRRQAAINADAMLEYYLDRARSAADEGTCFSAYYDVQKYCYNEAAYMTYFGWRNKVVASNFDVKGFELPQGLYPLGDMGRMDFRRVYKS